MPPPLRPRLDFFREKTHYSVIAFDICARQPFSPFLKLVFLVVWHQKHAKICKKHKKLPFHLDNERMHH
ncbi:dihydrodipicolinate reductase [Edwardsiella piscicida]|uniref:Dihydrodipicolinate reductase n=1 Tax=Edwardsiella piscicida TaxID=1263550 RepID=A0AAU8PML2_EDWPI|nr:dihydrodipicolinate reductase [Edwardsiella tarda EIB202]